MIEQELGSFIELGRLMTRKHRKLLTHILFRHYYDPGYDGATQLKDSELGSMYPNWTQIILRLMDVQSLQDLTYHNEEFALSVCKEAVSWLRNTYGKFWNSHGFKDEEGRLDQYEQELTDISGQAWTQVLNELVQTYPEWSQSWNFYTRQIQLLAPKPTDGDPAYSLENPDRLKVLYQRILSDWKRQLDEKKTLQEATFLEEEFAIYFRGLKRKVDQLHLVGDEITPFYGFLGQVWTNSLDNWQNIQWDKLADTAENLQKDPNLQKLAELLGRIQTSRMEKTWEEMERTVATPVYKPNLTGKSEIVGVTLSDRVSALLPSEVALLSSSETEIIFSKKFVEKKLLTFQYRSQDRRVQPQPQKKEWVQVEDEGQGPIIMCIDTSGSMYGDPERIAKALAFGILEIALKDKRKAYIISFSSGIAALEVSDIESDLSNMIDFLQMSFHGSTNLQPALEEALKMLEKQDFKQADVLVISDFVIPALNKLLTDRIQDQRNSQGTHFHSLHLRNRSDSRTAALPIFDHHWVYDMDDPKILRQTIDHFEYIRRKQEKN